MKKLLAVVAALLLAFSFGVFANEHGEVVVEEETEVTVEVTVEEEITEETEEEVVEEETETERVEGGLVAMELQVAIDYLYANGLTMFATEETFMGASSLRRDEAAAFFARFARDVLAMEVDTDADCTFSDLATAHQDLLVEVEAACQLGLMKGSDGMFMPTATFTNAQAMTVLVRLLVGDQEEVAGNWAANYYTAAQTAGMTAGLDADAEANLHMAITRADMAKMIEAAALYVEIEGIKGETSEETEEEEVVEEETTEEETTEEETTEEVVVETGSIQ